MTEENSRSPSSVEITLEGDFFIAKFSDGYQTLIAKADNDDRLSLYIPFEKAESTDTGTVIVKGFATTATVDHSEEIVDQAGVKEALPDYNKFGNIREMHQPKAVGVCVKTEIRKEGLYIEAEIVDSEAVKKVLAGVYKGFSIGGRSLQKVSRFIEALGKNISVITKLILSEISIVDRPCNPDCIFQVAKLESNQAESAKGVTLMSALDALKKMLGMSVDTITEISKFTGKEDAEKTFELLSKIEEGKREDFVKLIAKTMGVEVSKAAPAPTIDSETFMKELESLMDTKIASAVEKSVQEGVAKFTPTGTPDVAKAIDENATVKVLKGELSKIDDLVKGVTALANMTEDVKKATEENTLLKTAVTDLTTRLQTLEESRGARRGGNSGSGDDSVNKGSTGWGDILSSRDSATV